MPLANCHGKEFSHFGKNGKTNFRFNPSVTLANGNTLKIVIHASTLELKVKLMTFVFLALTLSLWLMCERWLVF